MAKARSRKRMSKAQRYKNAAGWLLTAYEFGCELWIARRPLPLNAPKLMQEGYVKAAKDQDLAMMASMRHHEREGRFVFLPRFKHLSAFRDPMRPKAWGQRNRYPVMRARAEVRLVKRTQGIL